AGRPTASVTTMAVPWTSPVPATVKGIIHVPVHNTPIKAGRREALLIAIAKARRWIDDLVHGRAASFAVIARREGKAQRHIRLFAPLAFVSPRIVSALLDGTAPADLTRTKLPRALPPCWAEQERRVRTSAPFHGSFPRTPGAGCCDRSSAKGGKSTDLPMSQKCGVDIKSRANSTSDSSSAISLLARLNFPVIAKKFPVMAAKIPCSVAQGIWL